MNTLRGWIQCLILVGLASFAQSSLAKKTQENNDSQFQRRILFYVNQYRAKHYLKPLKMKRMASVEAYQHSWDMAQG